MQTRWVPAVQWRWRWRTFGSTTTRAWCGSRHEGRAVDRLRGPPGPDRPGGGRAPVARRVARHGHPVAGHRVERPDQPDVVRHVRLPEDLRLLEGEGDQADAGRPPQGACRGLLGNPRAGRARRLPAPGARPVGHHGTVELSPPIRRRRDGRYTIRLDPNVLSLIHISEPTRRTPIS